MKSEMKIKRQGFTLTELAVTVVMATIIVVGIGVVLVDSQKGWYKTYERVHGEVTTDAYVASKAFAQIIRKSTIENVSLGIDNSIVEVYYYSDANSTDIDRYVNFYKSGDQLFADYGTVNASTWTTQSASNTVTLARNVQSVNFSVTGTCVGMVLTLGKSDHQTTVVCSAVRHN